MDIELDDQTQIIETIKLNEEHNSQSSYRQLEIVELKPSNNQYSREDEDMDDEQCIKNLKKKQLFKRRVCNKLIKYGDKDQNIFRQGLIEAIPTFIFSPPLEDFFAFGELILEGDFLQDPFNLDKAFSWSYFKRSNNVSYLKDIKFVEVEMRRRVNTNNNFDFMTQKYLNTPHQQIHELGELLQNYKYFSISILKLMEEHKQAVNDKDIHMLLRQLADEYYKKCMQWMKTQMDDDSMIMFSFSEFDLNTLDNDFKYIGYNNNLLKLIGVDEEMAMNIIMRRGRLEFLDGFSRLYRLMLRLYNTGVDNIGGGQFNLEHNILTLDGISVPAKCSIILPHFRCITKENFKDYDIFGPMMLNNYAGFRIFKFEVNPNIVQQMYAMRETQQLPSQLLLDMEYSLLSEVFVDKFYPEKNKPNEHNQESKESDYTKTCKYRAI